MIVINVSFSSGQHNMVAQQIDGKLRSLSNDNILLEILVVLLYSAACVYDIDV